jgi:hypothetical protein
VLCASVVIATFTSAARASRHWSPINPNDRGWSVFRSSTHSLGRVQPDARRRFHSRVDKRRPIGRIGHRSRILPATFTVCSIARYILAMPERSETLLPCLPYGSWLYSLLLCLPLHDHNRSSLFQRVFDMEVSGNRISLRSMFASDCDHAFMLR